MTGLETILLQIAGKAAAPAANKALNAILQRQDETLSLLRDMKRDVDSLLHGPYHTGLAYVTEAAAPRRAMAARKESLQLGRQEFMRALGQEHDPVLRAEVALCLSVVWLALESIDDGRRYALIAATDMANGAREVAEATNRLIKRRRFLGPASGAMSERTKTRVEGDARRCEILCERQHELASIAVHLGVDGSTVPRAESGYLPEFVLYGGPYGPQSGIAAKIVFQMGHWSEGKNGR